MTDPVIRLDSDRVTVEPGGQAQVGVTVSNPGSIVEGYRLDVLGEGPASWAQVVPAELSVYPQQEAKAVVTFAPPSGASAPSGTTAFGVRARSTVDADASAVAEGDLEIGKVFGLQAKIVPVTSSGRWRGRHTVQLSNWGNAPAKLRMVATDPDAALGFYVRPDVVELPLGGTATVRVSVRTRKPFLRGSPVRLPFQIAAERADAGPVTGPALPYADPSRPVVDGALNQKPILSAGFVALLGLVAIAVIGLVAYLVLRPPGGQDPGLAQGGPPRKPELLDVRPVGPDAVQVSWKPVDGVEGFKVLVFDGELSLEPKTAVGEQSTVTVDGLAPQKTYCFRLIATGNGQDSPQSDRKCAETPAAPPSATPTSGVSSSPPASSAPPSSPGGVPPGGVPPGGVPPGGVPTSSAPPGSQSPVAPSTAPPADSRFAGGKWVLVTDLVPVNAAAQARVEDSVRRLVTLQPPPEILRSQDYPQLRDKAGRPVTGSLLLVAIGPFGTQAEAEGRCPQVKAAASDLYCLPYQPQP